MLHILGLSGTWGVPSYPDSRSGLPCQSDSDLWRTYCLEVSVKDPSGYSPLGPAVFIWCPCTFRIEAVTKRVEIADLLIWVHCCLFLQVKQDEFLFSKIWMLWVYLDYFRNIVGISQRTLPSVYLSQVQIDFLFRLRLVIISLHTRPVKILLLEVYECLIRCRKISQTWYSKPYLDGSLVEFLYGLKCPPLPYYICQVYKGSFVDNFLFPNFVKKCKELFQSVCPDVIWL